MRLPPIPGRPTLAAGLFVIATAVGGGAADAPARGAPAPSASSPLDRIQFSGTLTGDLRWQRRGDWLTAGSPATSDLYLRRFEIGAQSGFRSWVTATAVLNSDWIGDIDANPPGTPLSLTLGQRAQPFGLFENDLVTDPLVQDAYETRRVGLTVAAGGPDAACLSFTVYKGRELIDHLFESALFDTARVLATPPAVRSIGSWLVSGTVTPVRDMLTLFGAVSSEPGVARRNLTANAGFIAALPWHRNLTCDLEWMRALQRQVFRLSADADPASGPVDGCREGALSATLTYKFVLRPRTTRGGGNYAGRKAHIREHPFEVATRYERFTDDGLTRVLQAWSLRERASIGGRYTFFDDGRIFAYAELEWRHSQRRLPDRRPTPVDGRNDEVYLRLGLDF
ncbi:MAG: hypothetical protein ACYDIE_01975 [Candidatus Krumholzibacteriia bacterium]